MQMGGRGQLLPTVRLPLFNPRIYPLESKRCGRGAADAKIAIEDYAFKDTVPESTFV
jgi:hypothetical protein